MTQKEFEERTGLKLTADNYTEVETCYMNTDLDKDAFCKLWMKNPAALKEIEQKTVLVRELYEERKCLANPARGKRIFGEDEMDAELCIKDQWNLSIAKIHLGDVESSNILCEEIARRWNEFEEWHECKENTNDVPKRNTPCLLRVEYKEIATGIVEIGYLTSVWNEYGWTEDYLDNFDKSEFEVTITHWKPINKPKGVEE